MLGLGPSANEVIRLIEQWRPERSYRSERKFQADLYDWLDSQLNNQPMGLLGGGERVPIHRERGGENVDIAVGDDIAIELKRGFSSSQKKRLRGQIEEYRDTYPTVIAVACGIEDIHAWQDLQDVYRGGGGGLGLGLAGGRGQVYFVHKRKSSFGQGRQGGAGDGFFDDTGLW